MRGRRRARSSAFVALIALTCLSLVILDDVLPITAPLFYAMCMIFTDQVEDFIFMWPTFIPLGIAIAFFLIRNRTPPAQTRFHDGAAAGALPLC